MQKPQLAQGAQILAIPTLVRQLPVPIRKIIGDLSDLNRVLVGLIYGKCDVRLKVFPPISSIKIADFASPSRSIDLTVVSSGASEASEGAGNLIL